MWKKIWCLWPILFFVACVPENNQDYLEYQVSYADVPQREAASLYLPKQFDGKIPLVLFLHGYLANPKILAADFGISAMVASKKIALLLPHGAPDRFGVKSWNVGTPCCGKKVDGVDDVSYLSGLLQEVAGRYPIDTDKIYVAGYSNGAFMAQRMACEKAEMFAGVLSISGTGFQDFSQCKPAKPLKILHLHGDKDPIIQVDGGKFFYFPKHISAEALVNLWAGWNGCSSPPATFSSEDRTSPHNPGQEILHEKWDNCQGGSWVEFLLSKGDRHSMHFDDGFIAELFDKLMQ